MTDPVPAFDAVHAAYRPKIVRYFARRVGEHEAEDLAQEVFVRVARGLSTFRGDSRLSTWIYRIARNVAVDRLRAGTAMRAAPPAPPEADVDGCEARAAAGPADSAEQALIRREMSACVRGLVDALPEKDRAVLLLGEMGEMRDREVAEALGVTVGAAKIRLHRARARLRKTMERRCELYRDPNNTLSCDEKPGA